MDKLGITILPDREDAFGAFGSSRQWTQNWHPTLYCVLSIVGADSSRVDHCDRGEDLQEENSAASGGGK